MGIDYLLFMKSIHVEEVSRVVTLQYTYPLFIAPMGFIFLNEGLTPANYGGILLLVASTFMISFKKIGKETLFSSVVADDSIERGHRYRKCVSKIPLRLHELLEFHLPAHCRYDCYTIVVPYRS